MNTVYTQSQTTYEGTDFLVTLNGWEFILYLVIAIIFGYLIHYIFSYRRDYVRSPRKKHGFYYNDALNSSYYPNSEPISPRKIIYTEKPVLKEEVPVEQDFLDFDFESKTRVKDDLKIIEGIGPKIEELLNKAKITTWSDLANTNVDNLKSILELSGKKFQMHDPSTWPEQAHLANTKQWGALESFQNYLNGGKREL